jgi:hypothetical protein
LRHERALRLCSAFASKGETDANNQDTTDDPSKQNLSHQEIEEMKKQGVDGQVCTNNQQDD